MLVISVGIIASFYPSRSTAWLMNYQNLLASWQRLRWWITLDGKLRIVHPWALLPGPLLMVVALMAPYRWLFFVSYVYLLCVLAAYLWVREIGPNIRLRRWLHSEWAQVGDELEERWELQNTTWLPLLWLEIEDATTLPGYTSRRVVAVGAEASYQWLTSAVCERRGVYQVGPLTAHMSDPFGLFYYEWCEEKSHQIVIYPPLVHLPPLQVPHGQSGGLAHAEMLYQHVTPVVSGLREYVAGDLLNHIHWPTVAKTQKLMVKEFDPERAGALWIVLDLHNGAYANDQPVSHTEPQAADIREDSGSVAFQKSRLKTPSALGNLNSLLELAIVLTCSMAAQALSEGRAVGLLTDDGRRRLVTPGHGPRQLWRILAELVDVQATSRLSLADVIRQAHVARAFEVSGAALVVVTPTLDGTWLPTVTAWRRVRTGGTLALLVAHEAAAAKPIEIELAALGAYAHTFEVGTPLPLLKPAKPRTSLRVSPLGKLVEIAT